MTGEQKLQDFLSNPTLRKEQKQSLIEAVMKKQNYSNVTVNLFSALGENNRFNRIDGVVKTFNTIMSAHRGEVLCTVTSAKVQSGHYVVLYTTAKYCSGKAFVVFMMFHSIANIFPRGIMALSISNISVQVCYCESFVA